jgi:hypothetical protein
MSSEATAVVSSIPHLSFSLALEAMKAGRRITRRGWNGTTQWLKIQRPDAHSKMSLPYIFISTTQGELVPWVASQTDLLAEDWELVEF